ncbi:MAG TPA: YfhO family protein [Myxococcales bacterium]|nr:YfhO family protein [Myxococcales bacterium]
MRSLNLRRLWPALAGLAAFLVIAIPVLNPEVQLFYRDTGRLYYPVKKYVAERFLAGELPFWDPWTESGTSLLGQMSPAIFHPWTLLYALPFDLAFKLNHLLPLLLAGVGTYFLARRLGASQAAATAGGLIFGASGYLVSQAAANLIYVVGPAGVPLALERFIALLDKPTKGKLIAAAAMLALCAYGGEPQSMLMCGVIGSAFAVARAISRKQNLVRAIGLIAAWGALAAALAAPVALPAAERLSHGDRAAGLTHYEQTHFSLNPRRLPAFFLQEGFNNLPDGWGTMTKEQHQVSTFEEYFDSLPFTLGIYLGSCAMLLACFGVFAGRRGRFFVLGAVILALAATGENLGLQPILRAAVPGYSLFRYAEKQVAFASLLFAVAAALGLDVAFNKRFFAPVAALCAAMLAVASRLTPHQWLTTQGKYGDLKTAVAFTNTVHPALRHEAAALALLAVIAFVAPRWPRFPGRVLAAGICGAALLIANSQLLATLPVNLFHEPPPFAMQLIADAGPSPGNWRVYVRPDREIDLPDTPAKLGALEITRLTLRPHFESLFHIEGVNAYFSNDDANYGALMMSDSAHQAFDLLTVAFFVVMPGALSPQEAKELGFVPANYGMWIQLLQPTPRAILLDQVMIEPDMATIGEQLQEVNATRVGMFLPRDAAAVANVNGKAESPGTATILRPSPEKILVNINAVSESVLEVGEHYDPGWRAEVDGKPAPVVALDGAIEAAVVPAGRHQVEFHFWPVGFTPGLIVAAAALAITLGAGRRSKP